MDKKELLLKTIEIIQIIVYLIKNDNSFLVTKVPGYTHRNISQNK